MRVFTDLTWRLELLVFFLHHWIWYTSYYLKPNAKSINKVSDHSSNTFVPGAVQPLACVDMQVGMHVILSLRKTKLILSFSRASKITAKKWQCWDLNPVQDLRFETLWKFLTSPVLSLSQELIWTDACEFYEDLWVNWTLKEQKILTCMGLSKLAWAFEKWMGYPQSVRSTCLPQLQRPAPPG